MDYDTDPPDRQAGKHHRQSIRLRGYDYEQAGAYFVTICAQDRACLFGEVEDGQARLNEVGRMVQAVWDELPAHYPGVETDVFVVMPNHIHGIVVIVGATPRGCPDPGNDPRSGQPQGVAPTGNNDANLGQARGPAPTDNNDPRSGQPQGVAPTDNNDPRSGQPQGVAPTGNNDANLGQARGPAPTDNNDANSGQARGPAPTGNRDYGSLSLPDVIHRFKTLTTKRYADGVIQSGWRPFSGRLWQRNYYEQIIRNDESLNRIRGYIANNPLQWPFDRENPARENPEIPVGAGRRACPHDPGPGAGCPDPGNDANAGQPQGVAPTGNNDA